MIKPPLFRSLLRRFAGFTQHRSFRGSFYENAVRLSLPEADGGLKLRPDKRLFEEAPKPIERIPGEVFSRQGTLRKFEANVKAGLKEDKILLSYTVVRSLVENVAFPENYEEFFGELINSQYVEYRKRLARRRPYV